MVAFGLCFLAGWSLRAEGLDIANLEAVPEGNYLVTLEMNGKQQRLNLKVQGNRARCVNASTPALKGAQATFEPHPSGNGMFVARFRGAQLTSTQLWIFRPDGIAAIREAPDRGEIQSAVPVKSDSLEAPKAK